MHCTWCVLHMFCARPVLSGHATKDCMLHRCLTHAGLMRLHIMQSCVSLLDWISDTRSQGCTDVQSIVMQSCVQADVEL